jgi:hypothetical protein
MRIMFRRAFLPGTQRRERQLIIAAILAAFFAAACSGSPTAPTALTAAAPAPENSALAEGAAGSEGVSIGTTRASSYASTAEVSFWTSCSNCSGLQVTFDGSFVGNLTSFFNSSPTCGQSGTLTISRATGTYQFTARDNSGRSWNGSVTLTSGSCQRVQLSGGSGGTGGSGTGTGGTGSGGGPSGGSVNSSTGLSSSFCAYVNAGAAESPWNPMPAIDGLDVKLFYSNGWSAPGVLFRNRYHDVINFSYEPYRYGEQRPRTGYRTTLRAGQTETNSLIAIRADVPRGGAVCVVVDQIRFGAADRGPYYHP